MINNQQHTIMDYEKILDNMGKIGNIVFASIFLGFALAQLIRGCIDGTFMAIFAFSLLSYFGICLVRTTIHEYKKYKSNDSDNTKN